MQNSNSKYVVRFQGDEICAETLADILVQVLQHLEAFKPGTLERLSHMSRGKRWIVARSQVHLYPDRPDLAHMARRVNKEWHVGTNYSARDVNAILSYASVAAGLGRERLYLQPPLASKPTSLEDLLRDLS
ncbi:hypothetical protein LZA78_02870 [Sinirhodobacter sp. WL0062]|uniref:Uncharacterized protein n=1 Tax=Rhodobacter flavimaris TaxID=2907145 RepID=A0ABS8YRB2_9RHOB|nr:hypothetical protein [Sinirhodobacter sp. WL0062]MCE5972432.1 hypothetical protein [Sinirhodobacter sp. WL0062]